MESSEPLCPNELLRFAQLSSTISALGSARILSTSRKCYFSRSDGYSSRSYLLFSGRRVPQPARRLQSLRDPQIYVLITLLSIIPNNLFILFYFRKYLFELQSENYNPLPEDRPERFNFNEQQDQQQQQ